VTAEGDYILLMLVTGRSILKFLQRARKGLVLTGPFEYLNVVTNSRHSNINVARTLQLTTASECFDLQYLRRLFEYRALHNVLSLEEDVRQAQLTGMNRYDALNSCAMDMCQTVIHHCLLFMLNRFVMKVENVHDSSIKRVLGRLCSLFACSSILDTQWAGFLNHKSLLMVKRAVKQLTTAIRPDSVALTDAFDFPDEVLNSTIGRFDGNIYEASYESAKKSKLNQSDPFEGYEYLSHRLNTQFLSLRNRKIPSKL